MEEEDVRPPEITISSESEVIGKQKKRKRGSSFHPPSRSGSNRTVLNPLHKEEEEEADIIHNLPPPPPFTNCTKVYPSGRPTVGGGLKVDEKKSATLRRRKRKGSSTRQRRKLPPAPTCELPSLPIPPQPLSESNFERILSDLNERLKARMREMNFEECIIIRDEMEELTQLKNSVDNGDISAQELLNRIDY